MSTNEKENAKRTLECLLDLLTESPLILCIPMILISAYFFYCQEDLVETIMFFIGVTGIAILFHHQFKASALCEGEKFCIQLFKFFCLPAKNLKTKGSAKRLTNIAMEFLFYACSVVGYLISIGLLVCGFKMFDIKMLLNPDISLLICMFSLTGGCVLLV